MGNIVAQLIGDD